MAILTHLVATSDQEKKIHSTEMISLVNDLLNVGIGSLPAAILIGQARTLPYYWGDANDAYITPNAPGFMLDVKNTDFPQQLIWYYGTDEKAFQEALSRTPFDKSDCCISFPNGWNGWDGIAIYALRQPFLLDLAGLENKKIQRNITHCLILFSMTGGGLKLQDTLLKPILARYFGPRLFLEEVIDW